LPSQELNVCFYTLKTIVIKLYGNTFILNLVGTNVDTNIGATVGTAVGINECIVLCVLM